MDRWHPGAADDLTTFGRSKPPVSGRVAGRIYEFVGLLTLAQAEKLPKLGGKNPDIRWWDVGGITVWIRIDQGTIYALHVGPSATSHQRSKGEREARSRA